jgi:hypothetical protein
VIRHVFTVAIAISAIFIGLRIGGDLLKTIQAAGVTPTPANPAPATGTTAGA